MRTDRLTLILCGLMLLAPGARADVPLIEHVYPAGGRQGTTVQIDVGCKTLGRYKGDVAVHVSGSGVTAAFVPSPAPAKDEAAKSQARLAELKKVKEPTPAVLKELAELLLKSALANSKRMQSTKDPTMPPMAKVTVTIAPGAEPGPRELRLVTPDGPSNPLPFHVGDLPELIETDVSWDYNAVKKQVEDGHVVPGPLLFTAAGQVPPPLVTLPVTINGQIFSSEVDRYRFKAAKGLRLVISAVARELKPFLAEGSPGSVELDLTLSNDRGKEVAHSAHYLFYHDPVVLYEVPDDGEYTLAVKDFLYRGRFDFVYRVSMGELPFITSRFPLGGRAGEETNVQIAGWNLPASTVVMSGKQPGVESLFVRNKVGVSNRLPFAVDTLPECIEKEPNNDIATAQAVTLPVIINGRIDAPGDVDVFSFKGRAGERIVAEVYARRLESALDSLLVLTDAKGKRLAFNDDTPDPAAGRLTHQADSWLMATLPADGIYYVYIRDTQDNGGPEYAYRLRIGPPRPDFELRMMPSSIAMGPGASVPLTARVVRRDGFTGTVALALKNAPSGFTLGEGYVSPKHPDLIRFTLWAPPAPLEKPATLVLEGRAMVEGREIARPAVPAEEMSQTFGESRHLVSTQEFLAAVRHAEASKDKPSAKPAQTPSPVAAEILGTTPVAIPIEGSAQVRLAMAADAPAGVEYGLKGPPPGITMKTVAKEGKEVTFEFQSDAAAGSRLGVKGELTVNRLRPGKAGKSGGRSITGILPAIPFEVVVPPLDGK